MYQNKCFSSVHIISFPFEFFSITFLRTFSCEMKSACSWNHSCCAVTSLTLHSTHKLKNRKKNLDAIVIVPSTECQNTFTLETPEVVVHCFNRDIKWWLLFMLNTRKKKRTKLSSYMEPWMKWHQIAQRWRVDEVLIASSFRQRCLQLNTIWMHWNAVNLMCDFWFFLNFIVLLICQF